MKRILALAATLVLLALVCPAHAEVQLVTVHTQAPLRSGMSGGYPVLCYVPEDSVLPYYVLAFGEDGELWYHVDYEGIDGYISTDYADMVSTKPVRNPNKPVRRTLAAGDNFTVAIMNSGRAVGVGDNAHGQLNFGDWTDLVSIDAGGFHTVGLRSDGTVVATGNNGWGQCFVDSWTDITAISAGRQHTVGLRSDGTVVAVGSNAEGQCDVEDWKDVVMISAGATFTVALLKDGRCVATGTYDAYSYSAGTPGNDVRHWPQDVIYISAGQSMVAAIRVNGYMLLDGYCRYEITWEDVRSLQDVAVGGAHVVCLNKSDTAYAMGANGNHQCDIFMWPDAVSVDAGALFSVALCTDGTVMATGNNDYGQCNVGGLRDIRMPE
ncbi:MAG: chromosome condensation regulator [Clostridia bacterium]|nr:chromosome condensation regulator [Clostridia bacterium]